MRCPAFLAHSHSLQVISTARTCNLIIIVLDCLKPITHKKLIEHELEGAPPPPPTLLPPPHHPTPTPAPNHPTTHPHTSTLARCCCCCHVRGMQLSCLAPLLPCTAPIVLFRTDGSAASSPRSTSNAPSSLAPACLPAGFGIRLNKKPPEITFRKKDKGGINYTSAVQNPKLDLEGEVHRLLCFSFVTVQHLAAGPIGCELLTT